MTHPAQFRIFFKMTISVSNFFCLYQYLLGLIFYFFRTGCLCVTAPTLPEVPLYTMMASNLLRSTYICLHYAGINGECHGGLLIIWLILSNTKSHGESSFFIFILFFGGNLLFFCIKKILFNLFYL